MDTTVVRDADGKQVHYWPHTRTVELPGIPATITAETSDEDLSSYAEELERQALENDTLLDGDVKVALEEMREHCRVNAY